MKKYFWEEALPLKETTPLTKDIVADIVIIGAGITGISTAYQLRDSKKKIVLLDQGRVGFGVTRGTTGKLTYLQDTIYQRLVKNFGLEGASLYLKSQQEAIEEVFNIVSREKIDCDLTKTDSFIFSTKTSQDKKIEKEKEVLDQLGVSSQLQTTGPFPFPVSTSLKVSDTYVFHPLKYLYCLKEIIENTGIPIYENTKVESFYKVNDLFQIMTPKGKITAKTVLITCHYPFFTIPGWIPIKTYLEKSYVTCFQNSKIQSSHGISIGTPIYSVRQHLDQDKKENYTIFLSNSHRLGSKLDDAQNKKIMIDKVGHFFKKKPGYFWMNYDLLTDDGLPYIGKITEKEDQVLIATGYSTWGMTNGTIAGKVLADIVLGKKNPYEKLFSLSRPLSLDKVIHFFVNSFQSSKTYLLSKVKNNYSFYPNCVYTFRKNGTHYGVYVDSDKKKHVVKLRCPHLTCGVKFNNEELTWDCPCHGSRFDIDGNIIKGPAIQDIRSHLSNEE